jgi:hypothetical protein
MSARSHIGPHLSTRFHEFYQSHIFMNDVNYLPVSIPPQNYTDYIHTLWARCSVVG